ncbi:hypothetical protein SAMN05443248_1524 [Bradyrhizobium erythrophlei]|uniref:Uncharacterized protein n=1 Tax=Bradyrhizobium erythrophlei TaxID=1437360 RepID=A0A1M5JQ81_9BRAD|nr:hypothetical protein SAMN05443248_1524 [Bradyrhizobium erythrophlei]
MLRPSFETLAEFIIGPRFARTRWQAPQDEVRVQALRSAPPRVAKDVPRSVSQFTANVMSQYPSWPGFDPAIHVLLE